MRRTQCNGMPRRQQSRQRLTILYRKYDGPKDAVLLMGLTGSGKSTFISLLAEEEVEIGHKLESCEFM